MSAGDPTRRRDGGGGPRPEDPATRPAFVDEHETRSSAAPEACWRALVAVAAGSFAGGPAERYARAIRCVPSRREGDPSKEGASIVGFFVVRADAPRVYELAGRHHFSRYRLEFEVVPEAEGCRLVARTYADFPGRAGRFYRRLVIGSRIHVVLVRRMLAKARSRAER